MNDKNLLNLPEYPCTRCEHKTDRCISEPKSCNTWRAWNEALLRIGTTDIEAVKATSNRDDMHDLEERDYAAWMQKRPCLKCASQVCGHEPDGKGSCFAYCAWKVGVTSELPDMLDTVVAILRSRVAEYRSAWLAALPEDSHDGPLDNYTAQYVYAAALELLEAAINGDQGTLQHYEPTNDG